MMIQTLDLLKSHVLGNFAFPFSYSRTGGNWRDINFPPDKGDVPAHVCPWFDLLCQGAALLNVPREELEGCGRFCGVTEERIDDLGPLCGRKGTQSTPNTACKRIVESLRAAISEASFYLEKGDQLKIEEGHCVLTVNTDLPIEEVLECLHGAGRIINGARIVQYWCLKSGKNESEAVQMVREKLVFIHAKIFGEELKSDSMVGDPNCCPIKPTSGFDGFIS